MKKGMEKELLIGLIIALVVLIIIGYGVKLWADTIKYGTDKEACKQSVQLKASMKIAGEDIFNIPIKCFSKYRFIKNEKELEKAKETLANDMYDCWDQFGRGELDFLENYDFGLGKRYCFVCSKITFNETLKNKRLQGFGDYLIKNTIPLQDTTYSSFIFPGVDDETINQIYKDIDINNPLYILFYADQGFSWERTPESVKGVALVYTGAGCYAGGVTGLFVGGILGGLPSLITAPVGCIIGGAVSGGRWFLTKTKFGYVPILTLGSSREIERICQEK